MSNWESPHIAGQFGQPGYYNFYFIYKNIRIFEAVLSNQFKNI